MNYILKHFDTPLVWFSAQDGAEPDIHILKVNEAYRELLPLDLTEVTPAGVESWIKHRSIPKNRAFVDSILSSRGLSINRPLDILKVSKGLSLNDCYWVTPEDFVGDFEKYNLFDNRFSRTLAQIAFVGYGSSGNALTSSPEFTTNGMLPKCWRRENGVVKLYKGGTQGASNAGNEPYSEAYAVQIAKIMGVNAIGYSLARWKNTRTAVTATCDLP